MIDFQPLNIDVKDVEKALKDTNLNMKFIARKMMRKPNNEVLKQARKNARSNFSNFNTHTGDKVGKEGYIPLLKSFKQTLSKKEDFVSYIYSRTFYARFLEKGTIKFQGKPFLEPAVKNIWESSKGCKMMEEILDKELKKYWEN